MLHLKIKSASPSKVKPRRLMTLGLAVISIAGIALGTFLLLPRERTPPVLQRPSETAPSSVKPSPVAVKNYIVAPDLPRYITIPDIGVEKARIVRIGLTKDNQISNPNNIYDVGWYTGSSKPGLSGAMLMFGHISNWTANGVFYNLKRLKLNDKIIVERGDGKTFTFVVRATKVYPAHKVDMQAALSPIDTNAQGLNLITCTGKIIKGTSDFSERLVVYTSLAAG